MPVTGLVKSVHVGGDNEGEYCTETCALGGAVHWSRVPLVSHRMFAIRTCGGTGVTTRPSWMRKKLYGDGRGTHQLVETSPATIVGDTGVQFVSVTVVLPCT